MPTGADHWSWKESPEYRPNGKEWDELRARCRRRDGHACQLCGVSESDSARQLDVHHLTPVREYDDPRDANTLDNVTTLCRSCHRKAERFAPLLPVV
jgi:5-methylcytosine-specific restriction endonuclease McrA